MSAAKPNDLTPAQRAHVRRVMWLLLLYALLVPPILWFRATHPVSDGLLMIMATVCSIPCLAMIGSWGRYISDERDEYHQSVVLRRGAIATNATMGTALVWGCLQAFGVMPLVEAYWIPLVWVLIQGASASIAIISRDRAGA